MPHKGLWERSSPRRGESDVRESGTVSNEKLESGLNVKHLKMLMKMKMDRLGAVNETMESTGTEAKWRRLEVAVDSGACDSVINPDELPDHPVRCTVASKAGEQFASATGDPIPNMGEINALMLTREQSLRAMKFTAAPVAKPLAAVKKICAAGAHCCV